jgi:hypothetical protein
LHIASERSTLLVLPRLEHCSAIEGTRTRLGFSPVLELMRSNRNSAEWLLRLQERRSGMPDLGRFGISDSAEILKKDREASAYMARAEALKRTQYALGAMQPIDQDYTRVCLEDAELVGGLLLAELQRSGIIAAVRVHGSVASNTHISGTSDVDLLVIDQGCATSDVGSKDDEAKSVLALQDLRQRAHAILANAFPAATIEDRDESSIRISGDSLRRAIVTLPSHWHNTVAWAQTRRDVDRGLRFLGRSVNSTVCELPNRHIARLHERDQLALGGVKKAIRLCKSIQADAAHEGVNIALSSTDIASLLLHCDVDALATEASAELSILAEVARFFDYLIAHPGVCRALLTPDDARVVINTRAKQEALVLLSLELDDLAWEVAKEHSWQMRIGSPTLDKIVPALQAAAVPA